MCVTSFPSRLSGRPQAPGLVLVGEGAGVGAEFEGFVVVTLGVGVRFGLGLGAAEGSWLLDADAGADEPLVCGRPHPASTVAATTRATVVTRLRRPTPPA